MKNQLVLKAAILIIALGLVVCPHVNAQVPPGGHLFDRERREELNQKVIPEAESKLMIATEEMQTIKNNLEQYVARLQGEQFNASKRAMYDSYTLQLSTATQKKLALEAEFRRLNRERGEIEERLRPISGLSVIFVVIGLILFCVVIVAMALCGI